MIAKLFLFEYLMKNNEDLFCSLENSLTDHNLPVVFGLQK